MDAESEAIVRELGLWETSPSLVEQLEDIAAWKRVVTSYGDDELRKLTDESTWMLGQDGPH